MKTYLILN